MIDGHHHNRIRGIEMSVYLSQKLSSLGFMQRLVALLKQQVYGGRSPN